MTTTRSPDVQTSNVVQLIPLPHEKLDVYGFAIELVELAASVRTRRGAANACDQLRRAATSVALNIAEACGKSGADRARFFAIARGSALESAAALRAGNGVTLESRCTSVPVAMSAIGQNNILLPDGLRPACPASQDATNKKTCANYI